MHRWRTQLTALARAEADRRLLLDPGARRRSLVVCLATAVLSAGLLRWSLGIPSGDRLFYPATVLLAVVLFAGAAVSGWSPERPDHGRQATRPGTTLGVGLAAGAALVVLFLTGAVLVARLPALREPVQGLLAHARLGSLPVVAVLTAVNGLAEEVFYRRALFDALAGRRTVVVGSVIYAVVTAASGIPLLALAALLVGLACAVLRRTTRGLLAPVACHLTWSLGMLFLLDPVLSHLES